MRELRASSSLVARLVVKAHQLFSSEGERRIRLARVVDELDLD